MSKLSDNTRSLFFVTSPRTPWKFIPEIGTLQRVSSGKEWKPVTQQEFMDELVNEDFYVGSKKLKDPAFSARDRMNRAPQMYGFVKLYPKVEITPAGVALISARRKDEVLLRQLLKFQLPSPLQPAGADAAGRFSVKPFLEILRLIHHFGSLTFDEIQMFGLQLTDYRKFDEVCKKIETFRTEKALAKGKYKKFVKEYRERVIIDIYGDLISAGQTGTRESNDASTAKFIKTKISNTRDYTDALFRYLRATNYVVISQSGKSLSIPPERKAAVEYVLENIPAKPAFDSDSSHQEYESYLFDASTPKLYTDNRENLISIIHQYDSTVDTDGLSVPQLRDIELQLTEAAKDEQISAEAARIKNYESYDDIIEVFTKLGTHEYYDDPLMFEWNTWRAMTMIDGGSIKGNFNRDDEGRPLSTAPGNGADIICDYEDFYVNVEVTLQSGQKQYDNEGEPVARHVGKQKEKTGKETFCFFIAPKVSEATIAHFYSLHKFIVRAYGGKSTIVPLTLSTFEKMVQDSKLASYVPEPENIKAVFRASQQLAYSAKDEIDWFNKIQNVAANWLHIDSVMPAA